MAKYQEISQWLHEKIEDGTFAVGEKIPSENDLALKFGSFTFGSAVFVPSTISPSTPLTSIRRNAVSSSTWRLCVIHSKMV